MPPKKKVSKHKPRGMDMTGQPKKKSPQNSRGQLDSSQKAGVIKKRTNSAPPQRAASSVKHHPTPLAAAPVTRKASPPPQPVKKKWSKTAPERHSSAPPKTNAGSTGSGHLQKNNVGKYSGINSNRSSDDSSNQMLPLKKKFSNMIMAKTHSSMMSGQRSNGENSSILSDGMNSAPNDSHHLPPPNLKLSGHEAVAEVFEGDTRFQSFLRYLHVLPPHPNEEPINKRIRIMVWWTLLLDFTVAMVSIFTFGSVTTCCGVAIFPGAFDWDRVMRVIAIIYLIGIFVEVIPVVRELGPIPFNLLNPLFGFLLSFAVFVDDSRAEAISCWILEATSVALEFIIYRQKYKLFRDQSDRLHGYDTKIRKNSSGGASYKQTHLLRERRELRQEHIAERRNLKKHLIGVVINISLVCVTLLLIIFITKSGGMCLRNGERPKIFRQNQEERCDECQGSTGDCEICNEDGTTICYYPYY